MVSKEDKEAICGLWYSLRCSLYTYNKNFHKTNTIIDCLEDLFDNTKGIREDIKNILKIELRNIRSVLPINKRRSIRGRDFDKAIEAFKNFTATLQINLPIKLRSHDIKDLWFM